WMELFSIRIQRTFQLVSTLLYKIFGVDSKDCYRFYTDIKRRKNESRTYFIDRMQEKLNERMLRDEELERMRK
ncbi:RteC domain-containing protein, partial [Phocaeicola vulgatus]|uniref:RteC domain-containing protein n=1 Tax=Phocaeicola vulgatus TaxID=821 RepID=UPI0032BFC324